MHIHENSLAENPPPPSIDQTLQGMEDFISKFLVCSDHQRTVLVLWIVHTHCYDYFPVTPYLAISSPENQSGKTVCLRLLHLLCNKAWMPGGVNAARLINRIASHQPTLLLDNWNTILRASDAQSMVGFLNAGSAHDSHYPTHSTDQNFDRSIFCPKAFAGPGRLPASLADRCIPIALRRRKPKEQVLPFWRDIAEAELGAVIEPLAAWTAENRARLRRAAAEFLCSTVPTFSMRQQELAAPLLGIAEAAGGQWPKKARLALLRIFVSSPAQPPSIGIQLLSGIRDFFTSLNDPPRIHTAPLLEYLNALEERPWKKLTPNGLRHILQNYSIDCSRSQRIGDRNVKGFTFQHFVKSWESYLPHLSSRRSTRQHPTPDQVVTNQPQVVTNEAEVVTNEPQVVTNEGQVVTNLQPEAANPNVFNTSAEDPSIGTI
jgi:hypothetical protein